MKVKRSEYGLNLHVTATARVKFQNATRLMLVICLVVNHLYLTAQFAAQAKTLEVGIEHSEMLAPVPVELQPGSRFNKRTIPLDSDRWAVIPSATSGKWQLTRRFGVSSTDLQSGKRSAQPSEKYDNSVTFIGYQQDSTGKIWTSGDIESRLPHSNGTYLVPAIWELKIANDHSFTVVKRGFSIAVDPDSHLIKETKQLESFAMFDAIEPNKLFQKYSTQWFDASGQAVKLTEGQTEMEKLAEFKPVNDLNGIDVRASFHQFLQK